MVDCWVVVRLSFSVSREVPVLTSRRLAVPGDGGEPGVGSAYVFSKA